MKTNPIPQPWYARILTFLFPVRPFEIARHEIYLKPHRITHKEMSWSEIMRAFGKNY